MTTLLRGATRWYCPNCPAVDVTHNPGFHTRFHTCPGLRNLTAPMIKVGTRCEVRAEDRQDYVGKEHVQVDGNGRPIMAVVTEREDGTDRIVFAPSAVARSN